MLTFYVTETVCVLFILSKRFYYFILYIWLGVLPEHASEAPRKARRGHLNPQKIVCCPVQTRNPGPLQEQQTLLIIELSVQAPINHY